jgi:hypothetical protein
MWAVAKFKDWKFYRAFDRAPIKRIGQNMRTATYVKEVNGNLYVVDNPLFIASDMEVLEPKPMNSRRVAGRKAKR